MNAFLVTSLVAVGWLIAAGLHRVWKGPTVFDRLIAVALVSVNGVVILVLLGLLFERPSLFLDIALGYALLAFLLPLALGRYFEVRLAEQQRGLDPDHHDAEVAEAEAPPSGPLARRGRALEEARDPTDPDGPQGRSS